MTEPTLDEFDKVIGEIAELTDKNHHIEALELGAKFLGDSRLETRAIALRVKRDKVGFLDFLTYREKDEIYLRLMALARASFSTAMFNRFYMAY